jgi:hypothetical protein
MLDTYKFNAADGHTVEFSRTATGYDVHTRNAEGASISTVAASSLQAEILIAELEATGMPPKMRAPRKRKA